MRYACVTTLVWYSNLNILSKCVGHFLSGDGREREKTINNNLRYNAQINDRRKYGNKKRDNAHTQPNINVTHNTLSTCTQCTSDSVCIRYFYSVVPLNCETRSYVNIPVNGFKNWANEQRKQKHSTVKAAATTTTLQHRFL